MSAPVLSSLTVPSNGVEIDLVFDQSVSGFNIADFSIKITGRDSPIRSIAGSGTSWTITLTRSFFGASDTVTLSYIGTSVVNGSSQPLATFGNTAVTNSSGVSTVVRRFQDQQFLTFITFSAATFALTGTVTQAAINAINPPSYSMDQILDACVAMGVSGVLLTTKHDCGFSLWPTAQGNFNIGTTAWNTTSPGVDVVADFTSKARARGLKVGLYYNCYDPWWTTVRSGSNGDYGQSAPAFTTYVCAHLTELLSNYGVIDFLYIDSMVRFDIGYSRISYSTVISTIAGLQPNCVIANSVGENADLTHTQISVYENTGGSNFPTTTNVIPSIYTETSDSGGNWSIPPASGTTFIDVSGVVTTWAQVFNTMRCNFLFNVMPDNSGRLPDAMVAYMKAVGAAIFGTNKPVKNKQNQIVPLIF